MFVGQVFSAFTHLSKQHPSILGRLLDVIHNKDFDGAFGGFEFQP
jgi:hypothetical protein